MRKQQLFSAFKFQRVVWLGHENTHEGALIRAVCKKWSSMVVNEHWAVVLHILYSHTITWLLKGDISLNRNKSGCGRSNVHAKKRKKKVFRFERSPGMTFSGLIMISFSIMYDIFKKNLYMMGTKNRPSSSQWSIQSLFWWLYKALQGRLSAFAASKIVN